MNKLLVDYSLTEIATAAEKILSYSNNQKIFLFYGDMGAGKTTLIKSLCNCLGTHEPITSPTFSIINEYEGQGTRIYHFDFYRLKNQNEALDLGYEEYFYSGNYCFIEWPEKIADLLPPHYVRVDIRVLDNNERLLTFEKI
jgi:tRNA threonylcarbamoyladenosine biosynthesis protein TsaE